MLKNVGKIDKSLRILIGLAIIAYGIIEQSFLGVIGLIPLMTALMGWCPMYSIFGISSCSLKNSQDKEK
jgi:hypothetical protein